jgi:hypothetical protein
MLQPVRNPNANEDATQLCRRITKLKLLKNVKRCANRFRNNTSPIPVSCHLLSENNIICLSTPVWAAESVGINRCFTLPRPLAKPYYRSRALACLAGQRAPRKTPISRLNDHPFTPKTVKSLCMTQPKQVRLPSS